MNHFYHLLNPEHRENLTFVLTYAFSDDAGKPLEWELRQMNEAEQSRFARQGAGSTALLQALAATIIRPKLDDEELLAALTMRSGKPVRTAAEALGALLTWDELRTLKSLFAQHNGLDIPFYKRVAEFADILETKGDGRARLVHLALQNHHISPRDYFALTEQEQALMAASDIVCQKELEKSQKKAAAMKFKRR
ncbi:MAG: hypothetical protein VB035_04030 [Candidatus Fimivivens sp.]|nr:hypothetical protein [Candidatus Fimivivens sp.]